MVSCVFVVFKDLYKKGHKASNDKEQFVAKTGPRMDHYENLISLLPSIKSKVKKPILLFGCVDTLKPGIWIESVLDNGIIRSVGNTLL